VSGVFSPSGLALFDRVSRHIHRLVARGLVRVHVGFEVQRDTVRDLVLEHRLGSHVEVACEHNTVYFFSLCNSFDCLQQCDNLPDFDIASIYVVYSMKREHQYFFGFEFE